jgi:hypothetical protein
MAEDELDNATVVPLSSESDAHRERIRRSNERDQQLEREGKPSTHNRGYDEAADGGPSAPEGRKDRPFAIPAGGGADVHRNIDSAANAGDETPGGDNPTPDISAVDDIGRAVGLQYQDDEPLRGAEKVDDRDRARWSKP